jgi:acetyl-CoA carboxylase biotin carboxyl carrier protein
MADLGFELEEVARLIKLVESRGLSELVVEEEGKRIVIRGADYAPVRPAQHEIAGDAAAPHAYEELPATLEPLQSEAHIAVSKRIAVEAPMVGVFYRASGPDTAPYVEVGDHVEVGQAIGLLEAMKVFSEIESEHAGRVVEILAHNGQLVKAHEPIMYLAPD